MTNIAKEPPWTVGTTLLYTGNSKSGFIDDEGDTVWSHEKGVLYTVVKNYPPLGVDHFKNEETGELITVINHGWSALQSELDPNSKHGKGIDVDSAHDFEVVSSP